MIEDQRKFMMACSQSVDEYNHKQFNLYVDLICEELDELQEATALNDRVEQLDALMDLLVVTLGAVHSLGVDGAGAWQEVIRSNMSKIDPESGRVLKREDGKVLKPTSFSPPNLKPFVR